MVEVEQKSEPSNKRRWMPIFITLVKEKLAKGTDREGSVMEKKNQERGMSNKACPLTQQKIINQIGKY